MTFGNAPAIKICQSPWLICNALLKYSSDSGPRIAPIIKGVIGTPNLRNKKPIAPITSATCKSKVELLRAYAPRSAKVVIPAYQ